MSGDAHQWCVGIGWSPFSSCPIPSISAFRAPASWISCLKMILLSAIESHSNYDYSHLCLLGQHELVHSDSTVSGRCRIRRSIFDLLPWCISPSPLIQYCRSLVWSRTRASKRYWLHMHRHLCEHCSCFDRCRLRRHPTLERSWAHYRDCCSITVLTITKAIWELIVIHIGDPGSISSLSVSMLAQSYRITKR